MRRMPAALAPIGMAVAGLAALSLLLAGIGYQVGPALGALWRGAFGSWYAIHSATLVRAVPLIIVALGLAVSFRAGALNIGAEGQFYAGAIAATAIGLHLGGTPPIIGLPVALIGSAAAGALWIGLPVLLKLRFGVLEVISTLLLTFVAENLTSYLVQGPLQESGRVYPQSDQLPLAMRLPAVPGTRLHAGLAIGVAVAVGLWLVFSKTRWGFHLLAVGESPPAAAVSGRIAVNRTYTTAMLLSGGLAGLAGGVELTGVAYSLYPNLSPGYGYTAIAVALLARLHPLGILIVGVGFGALEAGASGMQRDIGIPAVAALVVEAVIILTVLIVTARRRLVVSERAG